MGRFLHASPAFLCFDVCHWADLGYPDWTSSCPEELGGCRPGVGEQCSAGGTVGLRVVHFAFGEAIVTCQPSPHVPARAAVDPVRGWLAARKIV